MSRHRTPYQRLSEKYPRRAENIRFYCGNSNAGPLQAISALNMARSGRADCPKHRRTNRIRSYLLFLDEHHFLLVGCDCARTLMSHAVINNWPDPAYKCVQLVELVAFHAKYWLAALSVWFTDESVTHRPSTPAGNGTWSYMGVLCCSYLILNWSFNRRSKKQLI